VGFLRLLDDPPDRRSALVFLTHGALNRALTDEWVKLALVQRALHGRKAVGELRAEQVRAALPKFAGRLLRSQWIDRQAPDLWERLLRHAPEEWRRLIERAGIEEATQDDPVPAALVRAMEDLNLDEVLATLGNLPLRESSHVEARLKDVREALGKALKELWQHWLARARFRAPLLVFDEAHHLKNPTQLSSLFAEEGAQEDSDAVRGPLAGVFARMLFLTATPFQLGHHELIRVLERFDGIAWDGPDAPPEGRASFTAAIDQLGETLDGAQAAALRLEQTWARLTPDHLRSERGDILGPEVWWERLQALPPSEDGLASEVHLRYRQCSDEMRKAQQLLKPWVIRHLKPRRLPGGTEAEAPPRRHVLVGASIREDRPILGEPGLEVSPDELLPFLLAVRAQVALAEVKREGRPRRAVFAEGLASSYEAYLDTRRGTASVDDGGGDEAVVPSEDPELAWYLSQLDRALPEDPAIRARHPKLVETVERAIQLWWAGEKSLIFCHYRATGRALRRYISHRLEQAILDRAMARLGVRTQEDAAGSLDRLGRQFFDTDGRLRSEAMETLAGVVGRYQELSSPDRDAIVEIALRFLRTPSFLVRYFPLDAADSPSAFKDAFERADASGLAVRRRIEDICQFLARRCVPEEREEYLEALKLIQTGTFRRETRDPDDPTETEEVRYLPNVRLANGEVPQATRRRLMLAFNAPFFPEILIASSVLGEGVDLHLDCRYVVHHDLDWNPSTIEQRTGRVDRIGAKAERARRPVHVYLPFVTATQDEKMFRVVRERERWFSVVMGEKYQTDERTTDKLAERVPFPESAARALAFDLALPGGPG
jgi:superfamily II DNA or RNA helicase